MKSKKYVSWMLAIVVAFTLLTVSSVQAFAAGEDVTFTVSNATVRPGQSVVVDIHISGSDIASFEGKIVYNKTALTLKSVAKTDLLSGGLLSYLSGSGRFVYMSETNTDMDGVAMRCTFEAASSADGQFEVAIEDLGVYDADQELLSAAEPEVGIITVNEPVTGVSLNKTTTSLNVTETETLAATVAPTNASTKTITWASNNETVAEVSDTGVVTAKKAGTATITVTTVDGGFTAACVVTVIQPVTGVTLNKAETTIDAGSFETLVATVQPDDASNKNVSWASNDPAIAEVDQTGNVTAKAAGTATITVTTADGGYTAACDVTVIQRVTGITLDKTTAKIKPGQTETLVATVDPETASNKNITWSSDNTAIAEVDQNGVVTAKAVGKANITVTTEDGAYTATCIVTVKDEIVYTVQSGETVSLPITIEDCVDLAGFTAGYEYDSSLLTLESVSAAPNFMCVPDEGIIRIASKNGMGVNGDVIVGYIVFTAKADLLEDVMTYVTFPDETITAYNGSLTQISLSIPTINVKILAVPPLPGDVNLDGKVNLADAIMLMQYINGTVEFSNRNLAAADVNKDGSINVADVIIIMQMQL